MDYQKLVEKARSDWEGSIIFSACRSIILQSKDKTQAQLSHLTFSSICKMSGHDLTTEEIVQVTQYLCGDRIRLFEAGFEYISEDESFILDEDNSQFAVNEGCIAHPVTGALIRNVKNNVFMFFSLAKPKVEVNLNGN